MQHVHMHAWDDINCFACVIEFNGHSCGLTKGLINAKVIMQYA